MTPLMKTIIDLNHLTIHNGDHYFYSTYITLGNAGVGDYVLECGKYDVHFVYTLGSDIAGFTFATYEGVTADSDGTLLSIRNNNRESAKQSTAKLRYNPSNIVTGSVLLRNGKIGTATNPANRTGGSVNRTDEVILKSRTKYLLRITNLSTSNNDINVGMSWYEV